MKNGMCSVRELVTLAADDFTGVVFGYIREDVDLNRTARQLSVISFDGYLDIDRAQALKSSPVLFQYKSLLW
ncbi:hypothetical protein RND59_13790 [Vibrio ruber]|uniref:hypothetical protein n=1 Tax=Vibrio ruber TaxID=184755 RepID=UPI002893637B|nr:hypothetical protein [Vibrio ruber]WNJ95189.1 hypothetical protein RND59_13790 [Vibrio ruber]